MTSTDNQPCREWDYFCDISYYNLWAVRPIHETQWGENTFHLNSPEEAKALCELLNTRPPPISYDAAVEVVKWVANFHGFDNFAVLQEKAKAALDAMGISEGR